MSVGKESFFWHKLHSFTGILPVGFYVVQHLTLNSFALAGPKAYNGVIDFFEHLPVHILLVLKYGIVWLPLIFHAVYGLFIANRGQNYSSPLAMKFRENRYFKMQRLSGVFLFVFLIYHMITTSVANAIKGPDTTVYHAVWKDHLLANGGILLVLYALGVLAAAYHLAYGIWNFCIRWGITISEASQQRMARFSFGAFVAITLLGWVALAGFFIQPFERAEVSPEQVVENEQHLRVASQLP